MLPASYWLNFEIIYGCIGPSCTIDDERLIGSSAKLDRVNDGDLVET